MKPIWDYQKTKKRNSKKTYTAKMENGKLTHNTREIMQRWTDWVKQNFQMHPEQQSPEIEHITEKNGKQ